MTNGNQGGPDHWCVITRNTIGSPVAALRNGPFGSFGSFGSTGHSAKPPYGTGSLGIEVADSSTSLAPPSEKVDFGNEVDFYVDPVLGLNQVGFHVFQTGENVTHGGRGTCRTSGSRSTRTSLRPPPPPTPRRCECRPSPVTDQWSPCLDATATGTGTGTGTGKWFLTGNAGTMTGCNQTTLCTFPQLKTALNDGGPAPTIYTAAVGKGRDKVWIGAVDGRRINRTIYDFEADGVRTRRAN
ncbi:hypothetical protein ACFVH0_21330 [Streptomyces sp. NPDC127117]|uniref:hypothetical protein n=1 Tax=Streptomyces sp. NPDC127117 TaxID=3345368 RepID=UPI003626F7D1